MLELVLWSCMLALTPWALELARKLISGAAWLINPAAQTGLVVLPRGAGVSRRPVATRHGTGSSGDSHTFK
jgi:hypothetical protein